MKKVAIIVMIATPRAIQLGVTPSISAIIGEAIDPVRATMLHKPIEVAVNRVGNRIAFPKYTKLNAIDAPNLLNSTKIGIIQSLVSAVSKPQIAIKKRPIELMVNDVKMPHRTPRYLKRKPADVQASISPIAPA